MPGVSIGCGLRRFPGASVYVTAGRVFDLSALGPYTVVDLSPEDNDATLYTGRFISTNGTTDRGIVADASAAGSGNYYLTGRVKPASVTVARMTIDGSTSSTVTALTADVWQAFTTATATGVTPSAVQVGYDGTTASAAEWSDVRLIDASDDSVVGHWQLNGSADADLDGYPALDSSGNGYHGVHTGCAGGTGESTILQTAGMDWNKGVILNGTTQYAAGSSHLTFFDNSETAWRITGSLKVDDVVGVQRVLAQQDGAGVYKGLSLYLNGSSMRLDIINSGTNRLICYADTLVISADTLYNIDITYDGSKSPTGVVYTVNGTTYATVAFADTLTLTDISNAQVPSLGASDASVTPELYFAGLLVGFRVLDGSDNLIWEQSESVNYNSPSNYLVPESDTNAGFDALGNAISEPRVNNKQINLFGDGEYALVPDSDSLDVTTAATWELWVDVYGDVTIDEDLITKYDTADVSNSSFVLYRNDTNSADELSFITVDTTPKTAIISGIVAGMSQIVIIYNGGVLTAYQNGNSLVVSGVVASPLNESPKTLKLGANEATGILSRFSSIKIGSPKLYNVALTADQVLQNYNAQKGAFGL